MPRWVEIALIVLLGGVVFVLPPLVEWVVYGRIDYAVIAVAGLLASGVAFWRMRRRQQERSRPGPRHAAQKGRSGRNREHLCRCVTR